MYVLFMTQENLIFDILQTAAFRKYNTYACVVNVIRAKVLPGSVLVQDMRGLVYL